MRAAFLANAFAYAAHAPQVRPDASNGQQLTPQRWATKDGAYHAGTTYLAGDFDGDGKTDIAHAWDDGGPLSIDAHSSTGSTFTRAPLAVRTGGALQREREIAR